MTIRPLILTRKEKKGAFVVSPNVYALPAMLTKSFVSHVSFSDQLWCPRVFRGTYLKGFPQCNESEYVTLRGTLLLPSVNLC